MQTIHRAIYDEIASWYQNQLQESWIHKSAMPALLHLLGGRAGLNHKRVCDLGCGSGIFTREVARAGACVVVGVDISSQLLLCAEQEEEEAPVGITYIQADAHHFTWAGDAFDVVTSNLSLMDMADLPTVARTIAALLRVVGSLPARCCIPVAHRARLMARLLLMTIIRKAIGVRGTLPLYVVGLAATTGSLLPIFRHLHKQD